MSNSISKICRKMLGVYSKRHLLVKIELLRIKMGFYLSIFGPTTFPQPKFFIGGCPRSGTTLLFEILRHHHMINSFPIEGHEIWRRFNNPQDNGGERRTSYSTTVAPVTKKRIRQILHYLLGNKKIFLEKTPTNCLRVPFLLEIFPDAKFIFVIRDGKEVINSLMEGWKLYPQFTFVGSKKINIKAYPKDFSNIKMWHFYLPPRWREYRERNLRDICFYQWTFCAENIIKHAKELKSEQLCIVDYKTLINNPICAVKKVLKFMKLNI